MSRCGSTTTARPGFGHPEQVGRLGEASEVVLLEDQHENDRTSRRAARRGARCGDVVGWAVTVLGRLRRGADTAVATVERQLELLRRAHAVTDAVVAFEDARALADAAALDRAFAARGPVGPLHGLPVTVKDWIDVEGFPCAGETTDRDRRPDADATVVRRLRAAGAVVVAKTRVWGRVAHPRDPARTVGGSSSGEAALVAAGASVLGIGSDSGGSIRLPAAWAGVCGLRPTAGRVPTTGHFPRVGPRSDGRTQIGPLAASVDGLELALSVMAGPDGRDAGVAPVPLPPVARCRPARAAGGRGVRGGGVAAVGRGWRRRSSGRRTCSWRRARNGCRGSSRGSRPRGTSPSATGRARAAGPTSPVRTSCGSWRTGTASPTATWRRRRTSTWWSRPPPPGPRRRTARSAATAFAFLMPASLVGVPALALPAGDDGRLADQRPARRPGVGGARAARRGPGHRARRSGLTPRAVRRSKTVRASCPSASLPRPAQVRPRRAR